MRHTASPRLWEIARDVHACARFPECRDGHPGFDLDYPSDSMGPFSPLSATAAAALVSLPTMAGSRYAARIVRSTLSSCSIDMMAKSSHNLLLLLSELPIAVSVIIHSLVR